MKIRCRKHRTSSSTDRQSTPCQSMRSSFGPFTITARSPTEVCSRVAMVSNLSFGSGVVVISPAQAHLTPVSTLSSRVSALSGQLSRNGQRRGRPSCPGFLWPFDLPAFASRVIHIPPRGWAFLAVGVPVTRCSDRTGTGLPRSTHTSYDRDGCLLYPEGDGTHPADKKSPASPCRSSTASPYTPLQQPINEVHA